MPASDTTILTTLKTLSAQLLTACSATRTLERWCVDRRIGDGKVRVSLLPVVDVSPPPAVLSLLCAEEDEIPRFRQVKLMCGPIALSEASNWYLPQRLSPAMRHTLDSSDIPFGVAVEALRPSRRTTYVAFGVDGFVHHAVVLSGTGQPIAVVHERYNAALAVNGEPAQS